MEEEKLKCLYYIKDDRNDKVLYIGETTDFKTRKYQHFGDKRTSIDAYMFDEGRENFTMLPFEDIDTTNFTDEELRKKEDELIVFYNTINEGFNKLRSGLISKTKENKNLRSKKYNQTDKGKAYHKEYRKTEKYIAYQREYCKEHKQYMREYYQEYYKRKKQEKLANSASL